MSKIKSVKRWTYITYKLQLQSLQLNNTWSEQLLTKHKTPNDQQQIY
jgi:hypothetical protein